LVTKVFSRPRPWSCVNPFGCSSPASVSMLQARCWTVYVRL
jgi:hypothetical protein